MSMVKMTGSVAVLLKGAKAVLRLAFGLACAWGLLLLVLAFLRPSRTDLERVEEHYSALVEAIHRFEAEFGEPPNQLEDLVPAFLCILPVEPDPVTHFYYSAPYDSRELAGGTSSGRYLWYGLGVEVGKGMAGWDYKILAKWVDVPLLLFRIDEAGLVSSARCLGGVPTRQMIPFDSREWQADRRVRLSMATSVLEKLAVPGTTLEELEAALGLADGDQELRRNWYVIAELGRLTDGLNDPDYLEYRSLDQSPSWGPRWRYVRRW